MDVAVASSYVCLSTPVTSSPVLMGCKMQKMEPCSHALEARQAETVARSMLSRINYPWCDYIGTHHCQGLVAKQINSNLSISVDLSNTRLQGIDTAG